ncbi:MAG: hypothetical protein IPJ65_06580 [Archangiaceae bacterium]|nr:hypothetical protein [Archangiaceae bacterium]
MSRSSLYWLCCVALAACGPAPLPETPPVSPHAELHARADAMLTTLLDKLWNADAQYFDRALIVPGFPVAYWNYAQGLDALADGAERHGGLHFAGWLPVAADGQGRRTWEAGLYDDENWMSLALLRAYDQTGERAYLTQATALYEDIELGWDETCCGDVKGGIWWDKARTGKATASNAGPVITGVRLYERTRDGRYLQFARKAYDYWRANMVVEQTGQVLDNIPVGGAKNGTLVFTYNEGLMIGAAVELHRSTGEARYLEDAHLFARRMLAAETAESPLGAVLFDGDNDHCEGDCHQFKGIGYRYLALLQQLDPRDAYDAVLSASAEAVWSLARDPATGFAAVDWRGGPVSDGTMAQQTSALFAVSALAQLRGGLPATIAEAAVHEAEDARHWAMKYQPASGVSGGGLLVSRALAGERVRFALEVHEGGPHVLAFHYRGRSEASRTVSFDSGAPETLTFSAQPTRDAVAVQRFARELTAGPHVVELTVGVQNQGTVELDALEVTPGELDAPAPEAFFLMTPGPGNEACPDAQLCWSRSEGADGYDVVVDGALHCSTVAAKRCCDVGALKPGPHTWAVWARQQHGRRSSPAATFTLTPWPASPTATSQPLADEQLRWQWPASEDAWDGYELLQNGARLCAGVRGTACITGTSVVSPTVQLRHACARGR